MKNFIIIVLICVLFFILYTLRGIISLDSDFGWHIRMGQIILQSGIPKTDPFSYTMPSYPFVDHEWLTNVLIAKLYPHIGMLGLAVISALLVILTFLIQLPRKFFHWSILPNILIFTALFSIGGVRTQVISWFLFSIMFWIVLHYSRNRYIRYGLILMMLVWTNLHGSFPIGLALLLVFYITRWYMHKKIILEDACIFLLSVGVTFINPYGYKLWWEVWMQMSDHSLHWSILEWMPAILFVNIPLWMYTVISTTLLYRYHKHFPLFEKTAYLLFLLAGLSAYRHMPFWIIVALRPTLEAMSLFYAEVTGYLYGKERFQIFGGILLALALLGLVWELGWYFATAPYAIEHKNYPIKAIAYIKNHTPQGNIFTIYEWGGYFDWKLPEKRVFIDGRMPSFRFKAPNKAESNYIFKEYQKGIYGKKKDFNAMVKKYNIQMVVMPRHKENSKGTLDVLFDYLFEKYFKKYSKDKKPEENKFEDLKIIYQDDTTIVYIVKKT